MAMAAVLGVVLGFLAHLLGFEWPKELQYLAMFAAVVDLCIQNSKLRIFLNLFCEVVCCIELTRTEEEFP